MAVSRTKGIRVLLENHAGALNQLRGLVPLSNLSMFESLDGTIKPARFLSTTTLRDGVLWFGTWYATLPNKRKDP